MVEGAPNSTEKTAASPLAGADPATPMMTQGIGPGAFGSTLPPQDEAPSQALLPTADQTVLFICDAGPDLDAICMHLLSTGSRPLLVARVADAPAPSLVPRHCFVDWSLEGAPAFISELGRSPSELWPVAIVESARESALAYASGAIATVSKPMRLDEVSSCFQGLLVRRERQRTQTALLEHDQRVSAATAFDGMLRTLGQELRNPLATALANVEYLTEVDQSAISPLSEEEHLAILTDTLDAMQQLRSTLEGMSVFMPHEPARLEPVRLWHVAQRVLDDLPNGVHLVELSGDTQVRGWCDESALVQVLSTLVKRAIQRQLGAPGPQATLHVYTHDTEARLTVRELSPSEPSGKKPEDPFQPLRPRSETAHGGLQLAAARHAVVKMGGALNYFRQTRAGCAFRVRLRLAQPDRLG